MIYITYLGNQNSMLFGMVVSSVQLNVSWLIFVLGIFKFTGTSAAVRFRAPCVSQPVTAQ